MCKEHDQAYSSRSVLFRLPLWRPPITLRGPSSDKVWRGHGGAAVCYVLGSLGRYQQGWQPLVTRPGAGVKLTGYMVSLLTEVPALQSPGNRSILELERVQTRWRYAGDETNLSSM